MIDDLDATVSPAAFALPAIDVVVRDQVIDFSILGKEIGEALHGKRIVCIVITPFLISRIQIAGRSPTVFMESEVSLGCQKFQNVVRILHNSIDVVL